MARLRLAVFIAVGILVAVVVLPRTRWIFANDVSSLANPYAPTFSRCLDPTSWPPQGHELARAVATAMASPELAGEQTLESRGLTPLVNYCRAHPDDAAAWSHLMRALARMPLQIGNAKPASTGSRAESLEREQRLAVLREAIANGRRLEPDNAYFPLMESLMEADRGDRDAANRLLVGASRLSGFDDHAQEEAPMMYSAAVAACGYRGHGMQIAAEAGINFTHVAWLVRLRELAKTPEGTADADTRAAILRSAHKVAKAAKYPILVLAMKSVFVRAATLSNSLRELPDEKVSVAVRELDKELGGNELESYWNDFRKVRFASRAAEEGASIEGALSRVSSQPFDALTLLFVALLSFPASFLAVGISRAKLKFFGAGKSQEARKLWVLWTIVLTVAIAAVVVATSYPSSAGFTTVGSTSGQALGSGGTVVGVCALMIAVALIMLPRRGSAPLVVLALLWSAVPALYLVHIVQSLQVDQQLGQYQRQLPEELSRVRGDWS